MTTQHSKYVHPKLNFHYCLESSTKQLSQTSISANHRPQAERDLVQGPMSEYASNEDSPKAFQSN